MANNDQLMTSLISDKIEKKMEIVKRLQSEEAQKARKLLETAMSHLEAYRVVEKSILKKLNGKIK